MSSNDPTSGGPIDVPVAPSIIKEEEAQQQLQQQQQQQKGTPSDAEETCGCGSFQPEGMQLLARSSTYLICLSLMVLTQSMLVAGFTNSVVSTIERRYNLRSSESGFVISSYDITCVIAVIIISYYGDKYNRARWIGIGGILLGIGAIIFTLPHFIGGKYSHVKVYNETEADVNLCNSTHNLDEQTKREEKPDCSVGNPETWAYAIFVTANMIIGVGASPIYTLGPTYLYDNVKSNKYALYAAVMYSMCALGPAIGFLVGAYFLSIFVDITSAPPGVTENTPGWVGAWWLGFTVCSILALIMGVPLMLFPKRLPDKFKRVEVDSDPALRTPNTDLKAFPRHMWKLLTNKTWLYISLVLVMEQSISTGFVTFIAKYFQVSFNISASKANIITGAVIIPGAFFGIILGGYLMKKLSLDLLGIAKILLIMHLVPTIAVVVLLFLGCKNVDLAGITAHYGASDRVVDIIHVNYKENLTSACNNLCACSQTLYQPVCGFDQKTYYSPCHAGCTKLNVYRTPKGLTVRNYSSCACVYEDFVHQAAASTGKCDKGCYNLIPFLVILFLIVFITCLGQNPALLITLRSVESSSRSFALGMQNVLIRLLAFIPTPIYFGRIFDSSCMLFAPSCDNTGACQEYNVQQLPFNLFGTCLGLKLITFLFLILTYISLRCGKTKSSYDMTCGEYKVDGSLPSTTPTTPDTDITTVSTVCTSYTTTTHI